MTHQTEIKGFYENSFRELYYVWGAKRHLGFHYGFYDSAHKSHDEAILNMNRILAERAKIRASTRVLDAGCGIGGSAIWLAKNLGAHVTGITISEKQCSIAKNLARKFDVEELTDFFVQDYAHTNLSDNSFDVVWAIESMSYATNKLDFITESKRVLKSGGILIIADAFLIKNYYSPQEKLAIEKTFLGWAVPSLAQLTEFTSQLKSTGYRSNRHEDISKNVAPSSKNFYKLGLLALPLAKLFYWLGIVSPKTLSKIQSGISQWQLLQRGLWSYLILISEKLPQGSLT